MRVCVKEDGAIVIDCSQDELARLRAMSRKHALATTGDEASGATPQGMERAVLAAISSFCDEGGGDLPAQSARERA